MTSKKTRRVIFTPTTHTALQKGIDQMVGVVRPTLGPRPRIVAIDPVTSGKFPELLDDGGTIVRRIIQIPDPDADMGAMLVRQMLWKLREEVGDGTATAAVVFESVYNQGLHYLASGGNAMPLRRYLENGMRVILDQMDSMTIPVDGKEMLAQIAGSVCADPPLAKVMGEIFDIIGEYGHLDVRSGRSREIEREYVEGMYWKGNPFSRQMIDDKELRTTMDDAAILMSDLIIEDPRMLVPPIQAALKSGTKSMLILARQLSDSALSILVTNSKAGKFQSVAVKTPGLTMADIGATLQDIAVLTGGRPFLTHAGQTFDRIKPEDLGRARRVWADRFNFGILGGKGDPRALREHIADLRKAHDEARDAETRKSLRQRIGKLMGGSATLWVGGLSEQEIKVRKEVAERTADALRGVARAGVIPGGGAWLLRCRPALQRLLDESTHPDEQAAYRILLRALEEPMRTIIENAGFSVDEVMARVKLAGPGYGFDVKAEQVADMKEAGVLDAAAVQWAAVRSGIQTAALALTIDVLVHRKKPVESVNP